MSSVHTCESPNDDRPYSLINHMRQYWLPLLVGALVITGSLAWVRMQIVSASYQIHHIEHREREMKESIAQSTLRLNRLRTPARLEEWAEKKFGMLPLQPHQVIVLGDEQNP